MDMRFEQDSLGPMEIPAAALYGAQTGRALENFPMTGTALRDFPEIIVALAQVKKACAIANLKFDRITKVQSDAIAKACDDLISGKGHDHFVIDMVQGGAGTSTNMNANEVIANLALSKMGFEAGDYVKLHPNDHVNCSQSTNDVYPTAARLAVLSLGHDLIEEQQKLANAFELKAIEFQTIHKVGRTQLQDAVPMTLGQEFQSFATTIGEDNHQLISLSRLLREVNLGGTAIGTGINTPEGFREEALAELCCISGADLESAQDLIEASSDLGGFVIYSSVLKRAAIKVSKICNDLRLLSSGPRSGFSEIDLPPMQPGSSIMPGKVNPVIPEVVNQAAYIVIGNDLTITMAAEAGQLQLNAMEPVVVYKILESIRLLTNAFRILRERCEYLLKNSLVNGVLLVQALGYEKAAEISKAANQQNTSLYQVLCDRNLLSVLSPELRDFIR